MQLLVITTLVITAVTAFTGSDDKFLKKYAMMKIYESCFGQDVVKQIRKEMKAACAKCASLDAPPSPVPSPVPHPSQPSFRPLAPSLLPQPEHDNSVYAGHGPSQIDTEKLQQAILAYRPNLQNGFQNPAASYRPYSPLSGFYPFNNPYYQGTPMLVPAFQQNGMYPMGFGAQPFYSNNRMSRDVDVRGQLEALTSRISGKVKNVTCVMQELGYLDENLEPNYAKISERIGNLPVSEELRRDMQDGVTFCQQFSQCVPEIRKDRSPLSRELIRPMFFFKCYKHKKLEACVMKDVREKYSGVSDEDFDSDLEFRRQGKDMKFDNVDAEINELASSMYDFLYGGETSLEMDFL